MEYFMGFLKNLFGKKPSEEDFKIFAIAKQNALTNHELTQRILPFYTSLNIETFYNRLKNSNIIEEFARVAINSKFSISEIAPIIILKLICEMIAEKIDVAPATIYWFSHSSAVLFQNLYKLYVDLFIRIKTDFPDYNIDILPYAELMKILMHLENNEHDLDEKALQNFTDI